MGVICVNSANNVFSDDDFDELQESEDDDECVEEEGQQPKSPPVTEGANPVCRKIVIQKEAVRKTCKKIGRRSLLSN